MDISVLEQLFTVEFFLVAAGIYAAITTLRKSFKDFFKKALVKRLLPLLPLVIGAVAMMFIPDMSAWESVGGKCLHGLIAGFVSSHLHSIAKNSILVKATEGESDEEKVVEGEGAGE